MAEICNQALAELWNALGGSTARLSSVRFVAEGGLRSVFAVTDFAAASIAAASLAAAELIDTRRPAAEVVVDRRLASFWFGQSLAPIGWELPPLWDPIAGDYETREGWIRLHTNAPHHRRAALAVLGMAPTREAVAKAIRAWNGDELETAVVAAGGCAAAMRDLTAWAIHPQGRAVTVEPLISKLPSESGPSGRPAPAVRPLEGVRVLDMTRVLAGPVATRFLAGLGAEVLRIDPPDWDEPGLVPEVTLGKRCARLGLRDEEGRTSLETLLRSADVLVHGYRPGALDRLGLDESRRAALRPGLIDVSLDAYGWTGPWQRRRGFDSLVQMSSGIAAEGMRWSGSDRPSPLPV